MPTSDPQQSLSLDTACQRIAEQSFLRGVATRKEIGSIGLEGEFFPFFVDAANRPAGRLHLEGPGGVISLFDGLAACCSPLGPRTGPAYGPWSYTLASGGKITFEPGAQIEYSSAPLPSAAAALADTQNVLHLVRCILAERQVVLAAMGMDLWHDVAQVPQQLRAPRYTAMASYYDRRGSWGRVMMRNTASLQINLDLGPDQVWQQRWLLANLMSPLITAIFACSPTDEAVTTRALAWQRLDPTRTGFPIGLVEEPGNDPIDQWCRAALDADVLLYRLSDGTAQPGSPGVTFRSWLDNPHPEHGYPTLADLDYHLSTLFFEVRPRGFLELRSGEALPDELRPALVVLVTASLYDDAAREKALSLLAPHRPQLFELWHRAAVAGVHDKLLHRLAVELWEIALAGANYLGSEYFGAQALAAAHSFVERYTGPGRVPADELQALATHDPAAALAWASSGCSSCEHPAPAAVACQSC